jgi:hypothetical protein
LRRGLFEGRKRVLANLLGRQRDGISFNDIGCRVEVAAVKQPTTNRQLISAASKLPKQQGIVDLALLTQSGLTQGLASCCCCRFLLLRSSEVRHLPAYSVCNGTGNFPRGCRELSGRTGKFSVLRVSFYALRRDN